MADCLGTHAHHATLRFCSETLSNRYNEHGPPITDAFVIGIAGGSASGKVLHVKLLPGSTSHFSQTHVAHEIVKQLDAIPTVVILSQVAGQLPTKVL